MTKKQLQETIGELGRLNKRLRPLKAKAAALAEAVRSAMAQRGDRKVAGAGYVAQLVPNPRITVRPRDFYRLVAKADFWGVAKVPLGAARDLLGEEQVQKVSDVADGKPKLVVTRAKGPTGQ